ERSINDISKYRPLTAPATLQGRVGENNTLHLHAKNWQKVTIWFTRESIAWDKPVTILLNTVTRMNAKEIKPNLTTLLEDFYVRGDRQRLYLAKVELGLTER